MRTLLITALFSASVCVSGTASELTESYLLGPWCHETIDFGSSVEKEYRNWVFEKTAKS